MARIPEAEIGRLKEQVSMVSLAEAAGVVLRKTGADFTGCCPFREDGTPSLVISPQKQELVLIMRSTVCGSGSSWRVSLRIPPSPRRGSYSLR